MTDWTTLGELRKGAVFETRDGVRAVKSEYSLTNGQCECVLLSSGEYAHFPDKNRTEVQEVALTPTPPEPPANLLRRLASTLEEFDWNCADTWNSAARAVLSALASGDVGEWLPSPESLTADIYEHWAGHEDSSGPWQDAQRAAEIVLKGLAAHLAPRLTALRARVRELEAELSRIRRGPPDITSPEHRFLVLRKRDDSPWEVYTFPDLEHARAAYDALGSRWTGIYLVRIVAGGSGNIAAEWPHMPEIFGALIGQRNELRADLAATRSKPDQVTGELAAAREALVTSAQAHKAMREERDAAVEEAERMRAGLRAELAAHEREALEQERLAQDADVEDRAEFSTAADIHQEAAERLRALLAEDSQ